MASLTVISFTIRVQLKLKAAHEEQYLYHIEK